MNQISEKLYKGRRNLVQDLKDWLKIIFTGGAWSFFPVMIAVILVYIGYYHGITEAKWESVWKNRFEIAAVAILSVTVLLFLLSVLKASKRIDIVFLGVSSAFLCREIHFAGTSVGVYIAVGIFAFLAWIWRDKILDELDGRIQYKAMIFCLVWSYFISLVIQRRAFSAKHLGLLPAEQSVHIGLEELTEDFSHIAFFALAVMSVYYAFKKNREAKETENRE
jgi:hypothetical protein